MDDIDLQIVLMKHREEVCFDGGSWGIEFIFDTNETVITSEDELKIKEIASDQIAKITSFYQIYKMDTDESKSSLRAARKTVCFRVIAFINNISGNRLVRDYIEKNYSIGLKKCKSTNLTNGNESNFVPIKARLDNVIGPNLAKVIKLEAPAELFKLLNSKRKVLQKALSKALPDVEVVSNRYLIGAIEINLDIMYRSGIDFGSHPEMALRLSRAVCSPRTGVWVLSANQSRILPQPVLKYHEFRVKRLFGHNLIFGVPCYYGEMADKTEMYVACKERPQIPIASASPSDSEAAIPLKYWLHRFEWRIKKNARLTEGKDVRAIIKELGGESSFKKESELRTILDMLYKHWFDFLFENLNAPFQLTGELAQDRVRNLADCYHPKHSNQLADTLAKSGRVNRHAGFANPLAINRGEADGVFIRKRSHYNQDSGVNWDRFKPEDPF